jgi:hypothetical protein
MNNVKEEGKPLRNLPVHECADHKSHQPRSLRIDGLVAKCLNLTPADLELMPQEELRF